MSASSSSSSSSDRTNESDPAVVAAKDAAMVACVDTSVFEPMPELDCLGMRFYRHRATGRPMICVSGPESVITYHRSPDNTTNIQMIGSRDDTRRDINILGRMMNEHVDDTINVNDVWRRFMCNLMNMMVTKILGHVPREKIARAAAPTTTTTPPPTAPAVVVKGEPVRKQAKQEKGVDDDGDGVVVMDVEHEEVIEEGDGPAGQLFPEGNCIVCFVAKADTLVMPCMHQIVCSACSRKIGRTANASICCQCHMPITRVYYADGDSTKFE